MRRWRFGKVEFHENFAYQVKLKINTVEKKMRENISPVYSARWLGRHFVLDGNSLRWGRYSIVSSDSQEFSNGDWGIAVAALREVEAEKIAIGFEQIIARFMPHVLLDYLAEIIALYTYELAKKNLAALQRIECEPSEYVTARANVADKFQDALLTVFNSASQLHGLGKTSEARYCQMLHGMHDAAISIQGTTYYAAFTPDLVFESIAGSDSFRVWPSYHHHKNSKVFHRCHYE